MKKIRYALFCLLHFFVYEIQFAKNQEERDEFMKKVHKNDPVCG
jgi:hypothetical protein